MTAKKDLLRELKKIPQGAVEGEPKHKIMGLLAECWHEFQGAGETAMNAYKLPRAEHISWNPPILSFTIERHGATVLGSSRAELQPWSVDVDQGTASCEQGSYRQLRPNAPKLDVKPIVARICGAVQQGPASPSELMKLGILVWKSDDTVQIKQSALISGNGPKQTVTGRRRRFRKELEDQMQNIGWSLLSVRNVMTFSRNRA
jgi:hypothetical protein